MNILGKIGFAFLTFGALIINVSIILTILRFIFKGSIPWYIELILTAIFIGLVLMFLSALYDRYRNAKREKALQSSTKQ